MSAYDQLQNSLRSSPRKWLVTGVAGFIGSNLLEQLLRLGQAVVGLDNLSTGKRSNLEHVRSLVSETDWLGFKFTEGDISALETCKQACSGVDYVLHQAALGSVPRSMTDPLGCHESNVTGYLNMLIAARETGVKQFVYASSSAVYGDDPELPKVEDKIGNPLSPYAASKEIDEVYAMSFSKAYGFSSVGLRYFNVFGPRQDPEGAYAAVIPQWIATLLRKQTVFINGDGETSRDFCFIADVVQANLLAATATNPEALNQVYNVALGKRTTLNELFGLLRNSLGSADPEILALKPAYRDFRPGDVRHSLANIDKARRLLGFAPAFSIASGLELAMDWYRHSA